jgi:hypothetical protein
MAKCIGAQPGPCSNVKAVKPKLGRTKKNDTLSLDHTMTRTHSDKSAITHHSLTLHSLSITPFIQVLL